MCQNQARWSVHDSHPVITDASKDQGVGFFGGMEPCVFDMEWVTNDEGNFDAMHALYKQKLQSDVPEM